MKKLLVLIIFLLCSTDLYAGTLSGTARDWLGNPLTGISTKVYIFALNSSAGDLASQSYIAETTSSSVDGTWSANDVDIVSGTIYYVMYFYGGCYTAADNKEQCNLVQTKYATAP